MNLFDKKNKSDFFPFDDVIPIGSWVITFEHLQNISIRNAASFIFSSVHRDDVMKPPFKVNKLLVIWGTSSL